MSSSNARTVTKLESAAILAASACAAFSALLATWFANRYLPPAEVTEFLLFWSVLFGIFGIIAGIQQEVTRAVGAVHIRGQAEGAPVVLAAGTVGGACAILTALTSPLWGPSTLPSHTFASVALLCGGVGLYAFHAAVSGASAGAGKWMLFSVCGGGEALWRLAAMAVVSVGAASLLGLEAAAVSPVLFWIVLTIISPKARGLLRGRADVPYGRLMRNVGLAMGSSTASAVLVTGFPVLLNASQNAPVGSETFLVMGALILAVSICRSPIMIPLQAFQGVAIASFLRQRHRPLAAFARPAGALLGVGAVGAIAAYVLGPWLFLLIYPPKPGAEGAYASVASGLVLGALTFGSAIMALLVLSGTAVLALDLHRTYLAGWAIAAVTTTALLFAVPIDIIGRVMVALYCGPAAGVLVHLAVMKRSVNRSRHQDGRSLERNAMP